MFFFTFCQYIPWKKVYIVIIVKGTFYKMHFIMCYTQHSPLVFQVKLRHCWLWHRREKGQQLKSWQKWLAVVWHWRQQMHNFDMIKLSCLLIRKVIGDALTHLRSGKPGMKFACFISVHLLIIFSTFLDWLIYYLPLEKEFIFERLTMWLLFPRKKMACSLLVWV